MNEDEKAEYFKRGMLAAAKIVDDYESVCRGYLADQMKRMANEIRLQADVPEEVEELLQKSEDLSKSR